MNIRKNIFQEKIYSKCIYKETFYTHKNIKHQEDIIINAYAPNHTLKYMKQKLALKRKTDKLTIIVGNFNTPFSVFNIKKRKNNHKGYKSEQHYQLP